MLGIMNFQWLAIERLIFIEKITDAKEIQKLLKSKIGMVTETIIVPFQIRMLFIHKQLKVKFITK